MKVAIAMSGGIDSSVTAAILKEQGHECFGVHLDLGNACTADNVRDATAICDQIGIKLHVIDLADAFKGKIIKYYLDAYKRGETPNPCIMCNPEIKFGELLEQVLEMGADCMATGHYARVTENNGEYELHRGVDDTKDQTYFLYRLNQDQLSRAIFPLGDTRKTETRKKAKDLGFTAVVNKQESSGMCFIPEKTYAEFLKKNLADSYFKEGLIVDTEGNKHGRHMGLPNYTCGQRKGIRVGGLAKAHYVIKADHEKNELVIGTDEQLWRNEITADNLSFISGELPKEPTQCYARIRHLGTLHPVMLHITGEDSLTAVFDKPVRAFTEGQSIVFYDKSKVIGGGIMRFG